MSNTTLRMKAVFSSEKWWEILWCHNKQTHTVHVYIFQIWFLIWGILCAKINEFLVHLCLLISEAAHLSSQCLCPLRHRGSHPLPSNAPTNISRMTKTLPIPFLVESDMKYDVEAVALQTLLSANGVPTATLPVSMTNGSSQKVKCCKKQPLYIFVTSGPAVQRFLKQVKLKVVRWNQFDIFSLTLYKKWTTQRNFRALFARLHLLVETFHLCRKNWDDVLYKSVDNKAVLVLK